MDYKQFPAGPGVYFFKTAEDIIIYVGKATSLRERVRSYFQKTDDWKVNSLIAEHASIDFIATLTETEASILEAQLIAKYQPKFNVLLKDGQPFLYILFTQGALPEMKLVRNKKAKGKYFGPFIQKRPVRGMFAFLKHTFKLDLCNVKMQNGCLRFHLGTCAGNCKPDFNLSDYQFRLTLAMAALSNNQEEFRSLIDEQIKRYTNSMEFEKARTIHAYQTDVEKIFYAINVRYSEKKYEHEVIRVTAPQELKKDLSSVGRELAQLLHLPQEIRTIDCFDISHFQSQSIVGSCVRFTDGKPDKNKFRRFKIRSLEEQNDYAALQEIVARRYKSLDDIPDFVLIDGGKGQLNAVKDLVPARFVSLAKREERLYQPGDPDGIKLDVHTGIGSLLIALRDYAHHFAISYHRMRQSKALK